MAAMSGSSRFRSEDAAVTQRIFELRRGDRFTVPGLPSVLTFDHMDGMYCFATTATGHVCNIAGGVECVVVADQQEPA